jgi:hypothetical protein
MKRNWSLFGLTVPALVALGALALGGRTTPVAAQDDQTDCEAARCAVQATIDASCPCDEATTHGRYVKCVAHVVRNSDVPRQCRGAVIRCAARSTCGRDESAVTCFTPNFGKCQHPENTCAHDPSISCQTNQDCIVGTHCGIQPSADKCVAKGGTVGTGTSCCAPCPGQTQCCVQSSPMGAFDTCTLVATPEACAAQSGIDVGTGTCEPNPCPPVATTSTTTVPSTSSTTTVTVTSTTTTTEAPIQCCVQGSAMGAFDVCMLLTPAGCATANGIDVGPGACEPNPCPPTTSTTLVTTSTTLETTSSTTETTSTTLETTSTTEETTTSTSSTTSTTISSVTGAFLGGTA